MLRASRQSPILDAKFHLPPQAAPSTLGVLSAGLVTTRALRLEVK